MRMYDLIYKKKQKETLTSDEIHFIVKGFTDGSIPDYQMSAFLMAICLNGMNEEETLALTTAMAHSGDMLSLNEIEGCKVDKHSTGGVGDKTSLVIGPMVASLGIPVAKMSGRGLGHTGGTIDKLESFHGFSTSISTEQFIENVNKNKLAIVGQTANLAPADKKIYALRDVTATVDNISLIAASIMSKKLAAGSDVIVLDVKTGSGAFMKTLEDSVALAEEMVKIGTLAGRKTYAVVTDMNQPLGQNVGNTLEVIEAIEALNGKGPKDLMDVVLELASYMVYGAGKAESLEEARTKLMETITSGQALQKFADFITSQNGDASPIFDTDKFEKSSIVYEVKASKNGYVNAMDTDEIGMTSLVLGGGRETKDSVIDLSVGIKILKKIGDEVKENDTLAILYANDKDKCAAATERLLGAYHITDEKPKALKTVYAIVTKDGVQYNR